MRTGFLLAAGFAALSVWTPARAGAETIRITMDKLVYAPANVSVHVGDTIEWINKDFIVHSATARDRSWDFTMPPNKDAKLTLKAPGEIDYYCKFHPNMKGHISVKP